MKEFHILSAACLFDNKQATLKQVKEMWQDGTILVLQKRNRYSDEPIGKLFYLCGAQGDYDVRNGEMLHLVDDQTGAYKGTAKIMNIINYNESCTSRGNGDGLEGKYPIYVMK